MRHATIGVFLAVGKGDMILMKPWKFIAFWLLLGSCVFGGPPLGVPATPLTASQSLQAVIDTGAVLVYVPKGDYVLDAPLRLRSNLTLEFEPGTTITSATGKFQGKYDSLIQLTAIENIAIHAEGATFRMTKADFRDIAKYPIDSEFRHTVNIRGSKNVTVIGGTYADSGGDGFCIETNVVGTVRTRSENVTIRRVTCDNNLRQGISLVSCFGCLIEDSVLSRTNGKSPQAGIDVEPEPSDPMDVTIRRCKSDGNRGPCFMMSVQHATATLLPPLRIAYEDCQCVNLPADQPSYRMTGVFSAVPPTGYLSANIPPGSVFQIDKTVWKK